MARIFCSYAAEDVEFVRSFVDFLETEGFDCWHFKRDALPGISYLSLTGSQVAACDCFIIFISKQSTSSHQVSKELTRAHEERKPCIPILIDLAHDEFQKRQPEWREVIGSASTISLQEHGIGDVRSSVLKTLNHLFPNQYAQYPLTRRQIDQRFSNQLMPDWAARFIRTDQTNSIESLGPQYQSYVMIADYAELRGRTLNQVLAGLYVGDVFDAWEARGSNWVMVKFPVGSINARRYDILPATWKAVYRICTDPKRLNLWAPAPEEIEELESPTRNYWVGHQSSWEVRLYNRLGKMNLNSLAHLLPGAETLEARGARDRSTTDYLLGSLFGIHGCFLGNGRGPMREGQQGLRIFLQRNLPLAELEGQVIAMGNAREDRILE